MAIPKEAYDVLESIVGAEYVSQDPVDTEAYRPGPGGLEGDVGVTKVMAKTPACVIMPRTTEEVQMIVKVCNRFKIPFTPVSSMNWAGRAAVYAPDAILIDLKRMDQLEVDEKHMYAIVGAGVIYSQLQAEALKRGLYTTVSGGGGQTSVVANHLNLGVSPLNYRTCTASRRILGTEWVLPDGELLKLGTLALQDDPFWGEGPGPDLRGIIRGHSPGWFGSMGVVTKMAVKLFPFQPERLEPTGVSPDTALMLPVKRMKWINFTMPSRESVIEAMYQMGLAEVGAAATKVPLLWRSLAKAKSKEEFWELWTKESEESVSKTHVLRVLLIGYASEEQLEYEEQVLMDIVKELGGEARPTRPTDESWIKNADPAGMWLMTGGYMSVEFNVETLEHGVKQGAALAELQRKYTPPIMSTYGDPGWFQTGELGHTDYSEFITYYDPDEGTNSFDLWVVDVIKENIRKGFWSGLLAPQNSMYLTGPAYGPNYHLWMQKIKEEFDPNNISNPPGLILCDEFIKRAEWMKPTKDW